MMGEHMISTKMRITLPAATLAVVTSLYVVATPAPALACSSEDYIGTVCTVAFNYCPNGLLPADGRMVQINENPALYSLLGNIYGGDGRTTFALPDYRGRSLVGQGAAPGLSLVKLGEKRGQESVKLQPDQTMSPADKPGQATEAAAQTIPTIPPQMGTTYCIVTQGLYPMRP